MNTANSIESTKMRRLILGFSILLLVSTAAGARGIDLHALWDDRCADCHGHSAEFSRLASEIYRP